MKFLYSHLPAFHVAGQKLVGRVVFGLLVLASALLGTLTGLLAVYSTDLPQIGDLERYRPSTVTELYDSQGRVIGSFALQRRVLVSYDDFPRVPLDAIISTEDKNFENHWVINFWRVLGAGYRDVSSGTRVQGASTLTMQLSRNLFLSPERNFNRKVQETMLAMQIERHFTKQQIFTLYANQIFLGHGVYGFEAGAQYYFHKHAKDLKLGEAALLAGLPKAPVFYSPITYPDRALKRRNLVINNMLEDGKITAEEAGRAKSTPLRLGIQPENSPAPYFVEEVRRYLEKKYGSDQVHEGGLRVYTSLDLDLQKAATQAVLDGLATFERRRHWQGHLKNVINGGESLSSYRGPEWDQPIAGGSYVHGLVVKVGLQFAQVKFGTHTAALGPAVVPLARRTIIKDGGPTYPPHNFDHRFADSITLRRALAKSGNNPAVNLAQGMGISTVADYARRFGIPPPIPPYLPVALGAAGLTLYEQTAAFTVFPNDGLRIEPRSIRKVTDYEGHVLEEDFPDARDVIGARTARTMVSLLQGVVQHGTAKAARKLNHPLAGKTGTTNDYTDAWFIGFSPSITCGVWVGFDEKKPLGAKETGGETALT